MNTGMGTRPKRIAKMLACLCAIEMFLPGGTLIVLGYLLAARHHVHGSAEGEHAITAWRDIRGLVFRQYGRRPTLAGPGTANRRCEVPSVAGES